MAHEDEGRGRGMEKTWHKTRGGGGIELGISRPVAQRVAQRAAGAIATVFGRAGTVR
jgi:hypothetical protein